MNSKKAITLLVLATLLLATVPVMSVNAVAITNTYAPTAVVTIDGDGQYDDTIAVRGTDVTAGATVNLYWDSVTAWDGEKGLLNSSVAKPNGSFDIWFDVPEATAGDHYLWVKDLGTSATDGPQTFEVLPKIKLTPKTGLTGDEITISGYGYDAEVDIDDVTWDAGAITISPATPETDELGSWTATCDALAAPGVIVALDEGAVNTATATFTVGPAIALDIDEGPTGIEVEITGRGYTATATIVAGAVTFGGVDCYLEETVTVKADGTFELVTYVPQMVALGDYDFTVLEAGAGAITADESFEVVGLAEITVTPQYGPQGSVVTVEGWNFTQFAEDVVAKLAGQGSKTFKTDNNGHFKGTFIIPAVGSGVQIFTATQADYEIEAETDFRAGIMIVILSPTSGPSGTSLALTGTGFSTVGDWNATFGDDTFVDDTASASEISATKYIPSVEPGVYTITVWDIDADIKVTVDFEVTATTTITTDPVIAPAGYEITVEGSGFADDLDFMVADFGDIELVYYNATAEWTPALTTTWTAGDDDWDDGYFEFTFDLAADTELGIGTYTMNVTDGTGMIAQLEFEIVEETIDIDSRKATFSIGDTLAFNIESSFAMVDSYIEISEPNGDLYWSTDPFDSWLSVGLIQRVLYADQVAGGNSLVFLEDAPIGTWTWEYYDAANDEVDTGSFAVIAASADVIGGQVTDLANDISDLADQLSDVTDNFADVQSSIAAVSALARDAVTAANAATAAVNSVAATANTASEAASAAADAANAARDAASGLTTLVYGAIGAALVAALAAIVSLMQISRRIAG